MGGISSKEASFSTPVHSEGYQDNTPTARLQQRAQAGLSASERELHALRQRIKELEGGAASSLKDTVTSTDAKPWHDAFTSPRARGQLAVFGAGALLFTFSTMITKRSIAKYNRTLAPPFYTGANSANTISHPAPAPPTVGKNGQIHYEPPNSGATWSALEAFNLATLNVFSAAILMVGGTAWAMDISNMDDLRTKVRRGMKIEQSDKSQAEQDQEVEEWIASVLQRKQDKDTKKEEGSKKS